MNSTGRKSRTVGRRRSGLRSGDQQADQLLVEQLHELPLDVLVVPTGSVPTDGSDCIARICDMKVLLRRR